MCHLIHQIVFVLEFKCIGEIGVSTLPQCVRRPQLIHSAFIVSEHLPGMDLEHGLLGRWLISAVEDGLLGAGRDHLPRYRG